MSDNLLQPLFDSLAKIGPFGDEFRNLLEEHFEVITVPKNHVLLKEGQVSNHLFVVLTGALRYYYMKDGEEVSALFIEEGGLSASISSFFPRKPSSEFIETLEPCTIARIHHDHLQRIYHTNTESNFIARVLTEQFLVVSVERLLLLRKNSAEERYTSFCEQHPELLQRVPLKHIASYLGLTIETLSRIRAKLSKKVIQN
jgi:CRP-like cAMP-binding protein